MARSKIKSPKGRAVWPKLNQPDYKYKAEGEYSVKLAFDLSKPEVEAYKEKLDNFYQDNLKTQAILNKKKKVKEGAMPYTIDEDANEMHVKYSLKAKVETDSGTFVKKPKLLDSRMNPVPEKLVIGGGSVLAVGAQVNEWYTAALGAGVSLWIDVVVVYKRLVYDAASEYGFDEEDGFDVSECEDEFNGEETPDENLEGAEDAGSDDEEEDF